MSTCQPSPSIRVLIIEDEADLLEAMLAYLDLEGMMADGVGSLRDAERWLQAHRHDVLVLDLGLPDGDAMDWLERRPELTRQGLIITTARGDSVSRIAGARAGADGYLLKPVAPQELALRIRNLVRRLQQERPACWRLDATHWQLESPEGRGVKLTHSENALLGALARHPGQAVARDALVCALGFDPRDYDPRRMEILVRRLRRKARDALGCDLPLETVHRIGYAFTSPVVLG